MLVVETMCMMTYSKQQKRDDDDDPDAGELRP